MRWGRSREGGGWCSEEVIGAEADIWGTGRFLKGVTSLHTSTQGGNKHKLKQLKGVTSYLGGKSSPLVHTGVNRWLHALHFNWELVLKSGKCGCKMRTICTLHQFWNGSSSFQDIIVCSLVHQNTIYTNTPYFTPVDQVQFLCFATSSSWNESLHPSFVQKIPRLLRNSRTTKTNSILYKRLKSSRTSWMRRKAQVRVVWRIGR